MSPRYFQLCWWMLDYQILVSKIGMLAINSTVLSTKVSTEYSHKLRVRGHKEVESGTEERIKSARRNTKMGLRGHLFNNFCLGPSQEITPSCCWKKKKWDFKRVSSGICLLTDWTWRKKKTHFSWNGWMKQVIVQLRNLIMGISRLPQWAACIQGCCLVIFIICVIDLFTDLAWSEE